MPKAHFTWQDEKDLRDAAWEQVKHLPLPRRTRLQLRNKLAHHFKTIIAKQIELQGEQAEEQQGSVTK